MPRAACNEISEDRAVKAVAVLGRERAKTWRRVGRDPSIHSDTHIRAGTMHSLRFRSSATPLLRMYERAWQTRWRGVFVTFCVCLCVWQRHPALSLTQAYFSYLSLFLCCVVCCVLCAVYCSNAASDISEYPLESARVLVWVCASLPLALFLQLSS